MKKERREVPDTGISFLAVISCGFGAISLMLVLTFEPLLIEESEDLEANLASMEEELYHIRGEARELKRNMIGKENQQAEQQERLQRLNAQLNALKSKHEENLDSTQVAIKIESKLKHAKQSLTEEMATLLADYQRAKDDNKIGGIPVDSEYVIFVIDTSGSMYSNAWPMVLEKVSETLSLYPKLKGIQVMNDMGDYMFSQYTNDWIPDSQARRRAIIDRLRTWSVFSNSSPVEGITKAISTFYRPDRKISLYVFGDEFTGRSIQRVIDEVDKRNRSDSKGQRLVRIHAVGFPVLFSAPSQYQKTGIKFSILMRTLCERNGGTFVGLNDFRGGNTTTNPI